MTSRTLEELGLLTAEGRQAQVRFERTFTVPPEDLWSALTEPGRVARWLGRLSGDLHVGGAFRLDMADAGSDDPASDRATGDVLACEPPTRLLVSWRFPGEEPSEVEVRVQAPVDGPVDGHRDGAVLVLEHRRLSRGGARGYGAGWHTFLDHLGLLLSGREEEWQDRFLELLPTYRTLLPALGPAHVEAAHERVLSTDAAATADFLTQWLGWTWDTAPGDAGGLHALVGGPEPRPAALAIAADDPARANGAASRPEGSGSGATSPEGDAGGAARTVDIPGRARGAGEPGERAGGDAAGDVGRIDATLTWADVEALRESLVSAVGSGGRLADGAPEDVGADGADLLAPGGVVLRVRAEAGNPPSA